MARAARSRSSLNPISNTVLCHEVLTPDFVYSNLSIMDSYEEVWRGIPGFDGYEASSLGRIRRVRDYNSTWAGRVLSPRVTAKGYEYVVPSVRNERRTMKIHRLVCLAFHGEAPPGAECVRHLDGDPSNNRPENLVWGTAAENAADTLRHGRQHNSHLTADDVREIRRLREAGVSGLEVAGMFGISPPSVSAIFKRRTWREVE